MHCPKTGDTGTSLDRTTGAPQHKPLPIAAGTTGGEMDELTAELKNGKSAAENVVRHLRDMGAAKATIPVEVDGVAYVVCAHEATLQDPRDARIAALEGELFALRAQLAAPPVVDRDALRDAIADALGSSAYDCSRVWEAWGYETISQDDFRPVVDDEDRLMEIVDAVVDALKVAPDPAPLRLPSVEEVSARVHDAWMESKRRAGVASRKLEDGEELMVPFDDLSEQAKELDRATVRAVYAAIGAAGKPEPAPLRLGRGPTVEEVEAVAAKQSDGLGWWLLSFDEDGIRWEVCSLHVEDGAVLLDSGMSVYGFHDILDAIPLDASRQPCGVGVTQGQAMADALKDLAKKQTSLGAEASAALTSQDLWDMYLTDKKETP